MGFLTAEVHTGIALLSSLLAEMVETVCRLCAVSLEYLKQVRLRLMDADVRCDC